MSTYTALKEFITKDMQMSHVYQPVMLIMLLENDGNASVKQIAQSILNKDPTQIDYYLEVVKNMPGKVLTKNRGITERTGDWYEIEQYRVTPDGHCPNCDTSISGRFEKFAGQFGRRRTPVSVEGVT